MSKTNRYWLSSLRMTFDVKTDTNNIILDTAPIAKKFIGQPIKNLMRWMRKQRGFKCQILEQHR